MDPAEEIVSLWLQRQGFFVMSDVKVGYYGKEIDFLAVNPISGRKIHVEVHASVFPLAPFRARGPARYGNKPIAERIKHYYNNKFVGATKKETGELLNQCIQEMAAKKLNSRDYERLLVLGKVHEMDSEDQLRSEFRAYGVEVRFIKEILKEIAFKGTARDTTGRFLQLLASQLTQEAKNSLLGEKKDH